MTLADLRNSLERALRRPVWGMRPLLTQPPQQLQEEHPWTLSRLPLYAATSRSDPEQPMLRVIERDEIPR